MTASPGSPARPFAVRLRHLAEYALARAAAGLFGLLPIDRASALGGALGRALGPRLPISDRARANLERAFPDRGAADREAILVGMWDNLGRVLAEYPHLGRLIDDGRVEFAGLDHLRAMRDDGVGGFFVGGHIGNWEIPSLVAAREGIAVDQLYRAPNNPPIDRLLRRFRAETGGRYIPKGPAADRAVAAACRRGRHIGVLVDQKFNEGIPLPFFGRDAMTATAPARFALRFGLPIVCIRMERRRGARFRFTVSPPLALSPTGDRDADAVRVTRRSYQVTFRC